MDSMYFRTKFWRSSYVRRAKANVKYIYAYLLTNEYTKPSGIYKLYISDIKEQTGLNQKQIEDVLSILSNDKKILIKNDWIFVTQFLQETFNLSENSLSSTIKSSIKKQFVSNKIPIELIACFDTFYHTLSIPYPYPQDKVAQYIKILDLRFKTLDLRLEKEKEKKNEEIFILPEWIPKNSWNAYLEVRKKNKFPLTDYALNLLIKKLEKFKAENHDIEEIINESTVRGWRSFFLTNSKPAYSKEQQRTLNNMRAVQEAIAEHEQQY